MVLPFSLPQRPTLPSLSWSTNSSPKPDDDDPNTPTQTPQSAPARTSHSSSNTSISITKRLSTRSIRHTSLVVSRPTTPAKASSPLSASFGLPGEDDDDPFGVLALEKAGLNIKEAGTKENHRPGSEAFQYRPSPNSPVWRSSMASALSKTSRPSLDGRASIMTGRPSFAHSRQSSVSEIGTQTEAAEGLDGGSLRSMSPVREASPAATTSPGTTRKISPKRKSRLPGERPPPLKLPQSVGEKKKNEDPSPRTRLSAVQEKVREIEMEQKARQAKAKAESNDTPKEESDLDRLAREIKEMAYEHEENERRSEQEMSRKSEEIVETSEVRETLNKTMPEEETAKDSLLDNAGSSDAAASRPASQVLPKRASKRVSVLKSDSQPQPHAVLVNGEVQEDADEAEENDEDEDEDEDDEDYDSFDEEEPVIIEAAVQTPVNVRPRNLGVQSLQARAQVVSIHMPPPPAIPSRNPRRPRNSEVPDEDATTPITPDIVEDESSPAITENGPSVSKTESVHSARDNDTSSSFSLEQERDSFAEANHDLMSQTSHGSDNDIIETTPTKSKMGEQDFSNIAELVPKSPRASADKNTLLSTENSLEDSIAVVNTAHHTLEETGEAPADKVSIEVEKEESTPVEKTSPVPDIPERRRPFSFEAATSEESLSRPTIETAMTKEQSELKEPKGRYEEAKNVKIEDDKKNEYQNETKEEPDKEKEAEASKAKAHPIVIPDLPDDDQSEYEEDFS